MTKPIDMLAHLLYTARHRSRRLAKRLLREAGGRGSAAELDAVLAEIERHPQRAEIERHSESLRDAATEAVWGFTRQEPGGDHPEWLVCETCPPGRTFIFHLCLAGHESFIGEVFDSPPDVPEGSGAWPLDGGQVLANLLWLDGDPPDSGRQRVLTREARRQLRVYDQAADLGG